MKTIKLYPLVGNFAENKEIARDIRMKYILPALDNSQKIALDFSGVNSTTQSFIHALLSDVIRKKGAGAIDKIYFKNCDNTVQKIIAIVIDYVQDTM